MANDLNQCFFIGRLGRDPELRYTGGGDAVCNTSIAVGWKTKDKEGTEWVPLVFFGRLAEIVGQYCEKGSRIQVSGGFITRKWTDRDGNDRYTSEIRVQQLQLLDGKPGGASNTQDRSQGAQSARDDAPRQANAKPEQAKPATGFDDMDDDIPF